MENYNKIKDKCDELGCSLVTTFDEFESRRQHVRIQSYHFVRIDFIGICGHLSSAVATNLVLRKTGIRCKNCVKGTTKMTLTKNAHNFTTIEYGGYKIVEQFLSEYYEVKRTKEGCKADIAIRKLDDTTDAWIPIQLKVTTQLSHNMYSFKGFCNGYSNMLIMCVCISEDKIWIIPYNNLRIKTTLNISVKSKYNNYLVADKSTIYTHIDKYVTSYIMMTLSDCMRPTSVLQQREQEYVKKREVHIDFLTYIYPDIQNTATDFFINGKRIQEKVCGFVTSKSSIHVYLSINNGKDKEGKRTFRTYCLGDNDFYWFHSDVDDRFWIVPEIELYNRKYIADKDIISKRKNMYIPCNTDNYRTSEWIKQFEYNYKNMDKDKIRMLFQ